MMTTVPTTKLDLRQWEYIFNKVKDYDLKNFNRDSIEDEEKLKMNGKMFRTLYDELFHYVSVNNNGFSSSPLSFSFIKYCNLLTYSLYCMCREIRKRC